MTPHTEPVPVRSSSAIAAVHACVSANENSIKADAHIGFIALFPIRFYLTFNRVQARAGPHSLAYREETRVNLPQRPYPSPETDSSRPVAAAARAIPGLPALIFSAYCNGIRGDFHPPACVMAAKSMLSSARSCAAPTLVECPLTRSTTAPACETIAMFSVW